MTEHPDTWKMTKTELTACGCERCQEALKVHGLLNELIDRQEQLSESIEGLRKTVKSITDG